MTNEITNEIFERGAGRKIQKCFSQFKQKEDLLSVLPEPSHKQNHFKKRNR